MHHENENALFIGIFVAFSLIVATWLGYEYLQDSPAKSPHVSPIASPEAVRAARIATSVGEQASGPATVPARPAVEDGGPATQQSASPGTIYKCRVQGQIVYSDLPCNAGTDLKTFTPSLAATAPAAAGRVLAPPRPTAVPQTVLAAQVAEQAAATNAAANESVKRQAECKWTDEQIASIDARLRQPYYPQEGDRLKDERKGLNDRRFSLGC